MKNVYVCVCVCVYVYVCVWLTLINMQYKYFYFVHFKLNFVIKNTKSVKLNASRIWKITFLAIFFPSAIGR